MIGEVTKSASILNPFLLSLAFMENKMFATCTQVTQHDQAKKLCYKYRLRKRSSILNVTLPRRWVNCLRNTGGSQCAVEWEWGPCLPLSNLGTLGKSHNLSEPEFQHVELEIKGNF